MKKGVMACIAGAVVMAVSGAASFGDEGPAKDAKGLFEKKCGTCHTLKMSTSEKKTAREWQRTVLRMKNAMGAAITEEEARAIIEYLSENYGA